MTTTKSLKIIGITGTIGAGKGTVVDYLVREKGFRHYSVRGYLSERMREKGMPDNRDSMTRLANELREEFSPSYIIDELYRCALEAGENAVLESIRTPGEIASLREKGNFLLIAVDADPSLRFERIKCRGSSTDNIDYETFLMNEAREMDSDNPNHQNLRKCIALADVVLINNGTIGELEAAVEEALISAGARL